MRFWRCYKVMKDLWFIDEDNNIWKWSNDYSYSYSTIYLKTDNYIIPYSWETTKKGFNLYKEWYSFNEISESDAILELL